jgi:hypothetical protein
VALHFFPNGNWAHAFGPMPDAEPLESALVCPVLLDSSTSMVPTELGLSESVIGRFYCCPLRAPPHGSDSAVNTLRIVRSAQGDAEGGSPPIRNVPVRLYGLSSSGDWHHFQRPSRGRDANF